MNAPGGNTRYVTLGGQMPKFGQKKDEISILCNFGPLDITKYKKIAFNTKRDTIST